MVCPSQRDQAQCEGEPKGKQPLPRRGIATKTEHSEVNLTWWKVC